MAIQLDPTTNLPTDDKSTKVANLQKFLNPNLGTTEEKIGLPQETSSDIVNLDYNQYSKTLGSSFKPSLGEEYNIKQERDRQAKIEQKKADDQGFFGEMTNAVVGGISKGILTLIENAGYLGDVAEWTGLADEDDGEYTNWLSELAKDGKEGLTEYFKIYRNNPKAVWDLSDSAWYAEQLQGLLDSAVGYGLTGVGAFGLGAKAIKGLTAARLGLKATQLSSTIVGASSMNYSESKMMSVELYGNLVRDGVDKEEAAKQANIFLWTNKVNILTDFLQFKSILRGANFTRNIERTGGRAMFKEFGKDARREAFEEVSSGFFQAEGERRGRINAGIEKEDGSSYLGRAIDYATSEEGLLEATMGALGGPVQSFIINKPIEHFGENAKNRKERIAKQGEIIGSNKQELATTLQSFAEREKAKQKAVKEGRLSEFEAMQEEDFSSLAFRNFESGTTQDLENKLNQVKNYSAEEAKAQGLTEDYRETADRSLKKLKEYESEYIRLKDKAYSQIESMKYDTYKKLGKTEVADRAIAAHTNLVHTGLIMTYNAKIRRNIAADAVKSTNAKIFNAVNNLNSDVMSLYGEVAPSYLTSYYNLREEQNVLNNIKDKSPQLNKEVEDKLKEVEKKIKNIEDNNLTIQKEYKHLTKDELESHEELKSLLKEKVEAELAHKVYSDKYKELNKKSTDAVKSTIIDTAVKEHIVEAQKEENKKNKEEIAQVIELAHRNMRGMPLTDTEVALAKKHQDVFDSAVKRVQKKMASFREKQFNNQIEQVKKTLEQFEKERKIVEDEILDADIRVEKIVKDFKEGNTKKSEEAVQKEINKLTKLVDSKYEYLEDLQDRKVKYTNLINSIENKRDFDPNSLAEDLDSISERLSWTEDEIAKTEEKINTLKKLLTSISRIFKKLFGKTPSQVEVKGRHVEMEGVKEINDNKAALKLLKDYAKELEEDRKAQSTLKNNLKQQLESYNAELKKVAKIAEDKVSADQVTKKSEQEYLEDESTDKLDKSFRAAAKASWFTTTGNHEKALAVLANPKAEDDLDDAENQARFFEWSAKLKVDPKNPKYLKFYTRVQAEKEGLNIFTAKETEYEKTNSYEGIKAIVIDTKGPVLIDGKLLIAGMHTSSFDKLAEAKALQEFLDIVYNLNIEETVLLKFISGDSKVKSIGKFKSIEQLRQEITDVKESIRDRVKKASNAGNPLASKITYKSLGFPTRALSKDGTKRARRSVIGTFVKKGEPVKLVVATPTISSKSVFGKYVTLKPGTTYIQREDGQVLDLMNRTLNKGEVDLIIQLLDYALAGKSLNKTVPVKGSKHAYPIFIDPSFTIDTNVVSKLIYWGKSNSDNKSNQIYFDSDSKELVFGLERISYKDIKKSAELRTFLQTKYHHTVANKLNTGKKYYHPTSFSNGVLNTTTYNTYEEYLLEGTNAVLQTDISDNTKENPQIKQVYLGYHPNNLVIPGEDNNAAQTATSDNAPIDVSSPSSEDYSDLNDSPEDDLRAFEALAGLAEAKGLMGGKKRTETIKESVKQDTAIAVASPESLTNDIIQSLNLSKNAVVQQDKNATVLSNGKIIADNPKEGLAATFGLIPTIVSPTKNKLTDLEYNAQLKASEKGKSLVRKILSAPSEGKLKALSESANEIAEELLLENIEKTLQKTRSVKATLSKFIKITANKTSSGNSYHLESISTSQLQFLLSKAQELDIPIPPISELYDDLLTKIHGQEAVVNEFSNIYNEVLGYLRTRYNTFRELNQSESQLLSMGYPAEKKTYTVEELQGFAKKELERLKESDPQSYKLWESRNMKSDQISFQMYTAYKAILDPNIKTKQQKYDSLLQKQKQEKKQSIILINQLEELLANSDTSSLPDNKFIGLENKSAVTIDFSKIAEEIPTDKTGLEAETASNINEEETLEEVISSLNTEVLKPIYDQVNKAREDNGLPPLKVSFEDIISDFLVNELTQEQAIEQLNILKEC